MRQQAFKRHLQGKSFPITSMKTPTPAGEGPESLESNLSSEQLISLLQQPQLRADSPWLGEQRLLCCQLQAFPELLEQFPLKGKLLTSPEWKNLSFLPFLLPGVLCPALARGKSLHKSELFISWDLQTKFFHSLSLLLLLSLRCPSIHLAPLLVPSRASDFLKHQKIVSAQRKLSHHQPCEATTADPRLAVQGLWAQFMGMWDNS